MCETIHNVCSTGDSKDTTMVPLGKSASLAPGLVRPRHITLAPLKRNFIAPLSTC